MEPKFYRYLHEPSTGPHPEIFHYISHLENISVNDRIFLKFGVTAVKKFFDQNVGLILPQNE
jgi:hypothetical protein